jgi:hypothetical protein
MIHLMNDKVNWLVKVILLWFTCVFQVDNECFSDSSGL